MKPPADYKRQFVTNRAQAVPDGRFRGIAWSDGWLPVGQLASWVWQGKVFDKDTRTVRNRLFGRPLVEGHYALTHDGYVRIDYVTAATRRPYLTDFLRPLSDQRWIGRTEIAGIIVWFMLEQED